MLDVKMRKRIGVLIRTLLELTMKEQAEQIGCSVNSLYQYEAGNFISKRLDTYYSFYYEKLGIDKILLNVGTFRAFARWEQMLDKEV